MDHQPFKGQLVLKESGPFGFAGWWRELGADRKRSRLLEGGVPGHVNVQAQQPSYHILGLLYRDLG